MTRLKLFILVFSFPVILSTGCSKELRPEGMPELTPVTITVVQDGKPLADATISLVPLEPENYRWICGAVTSVDGTAIPKVHGKYSGAVPGRYRLSVSKTETAPTPPEKSGDPKFQPDSFNLVDPKFGDAPTGEEIVIAAGERKKINLDVGASVRIPVPKRR